MTFTDVWSRHPWVLFAKHKSDVEKIYETWKTETQTFFRTELGIIHFGKGWIRFLITDGGGEYGRKEFEAKLKADGIFHQTTTPDTPESNGIAERINQTLVTKTIAMLYASKHPKSFWTYAMATAAQLIARSPASGIDSEVPYTKLTDRPVDVSLFRPFGCPAYALVHKAHRKGKFSERATKCILIGYPHDKKAYLLMDTTTRRILTSRHVKFDEKGMPPEHMQVDYSDKSKGQWESLLKGGEVEPQVNTAPKRRPVTVTNEDDPNDPPLYRGGGSEMAKPVGDPTPEQTPMTATPRGVSGNQCMPSRIPRQSMGTPIKQERSPAPAPRPTTPKHPPAIKIARIHRGTRQ